MALVDVLHRVLGALKCVSCSVFFFQTEHLPLQTQFKEREVGGLQHSVSTMVLLWGLLRWSGATVLLKIPFEFHESYFSPLSAV